MASPDSTGRIDYSAMQKTVGDMVTKVNAAMASMAAKSGVGIVEMMQMQLLMNQLSQLSEVATGVVSASNTSLMSMARGVKG